MYKKYIELDENNRVVSVLEGFGLPKHPNFIEIDPEIHVDEGCIMNEDGTFISSNIEEQPRVSEELTLEDKINYIFYKQMGVIE